MSFTKNLLLPINVEDLSLKMFYVYLLKSIRFNEIYIGSTNDLRRRVVEHNNGAEISTRRYKPWRLVYYEAFHNEKDAREREKKLKSHGNAIRELKKRIHRSLEVGLPSTTFRRKAGAGFIAFSSLLIISAVTLAISVSVALLGITQANSSLGFKKGQETLKIAESCVEEALLRLRDKANYTGGTLSVGNGSCTITISGIGANRTVDITATISGPPQYVKKLQVAAKRAGNSINIISWQEME